MAVRVPVDPNEDLDQIISKIQSQNSKDVTLVLPPETRALTELTNFYALRTAARSSNINLSFSKGNKTIRGLAKLLGFAVDKDSEDDGDTSHDYPTEPLTNSGIGRGGFGGVPEGFVSQSVAPNPPTRNEAPQPQRTNAQDFFNQMSNFDPGIPSNRTQPPPAPRSGNGLAGPGDEVLSRENLPDFFNSSDGADRTSRPAPKPEFDFGGGAGVNPTMSFEDATRQGLINGGNLGNGFVPSSLEPGFDSELEEGVPSIPGDEDNAAGQFRNGGRKRGGVRDPEDPARGRSSRKPARTKTLRNPATPSSASVISRVQKILVPVQPRQGGMKMEVPQLSPEAKRARDQQRRRTNLVILGAILLFLLAFAAVLFITVLSPKSGTSGPDVPPVVALTLPLKTTNITNSVRLTLDSTNPNGVTALPGTQPATTSAATTAGSSPVASDNSRLPVRNVNSEDIKKTGEALATGNREVPDKAATGPVTLTNSGASPKGFGAGAVIYSANGVSYRLVQGVTIGAGNPFTGGLGRASATVAADKLGAVGNLDKAVDRLLSDSVAVHIGPLTGGSNRVEKFVTPADQDNLKKQLQDQARTEASNALKVDPGQASLVIKSTDPVCQFSKNPNDTVDESGKFQGNCTMQLQAVVYNKDQLTTAVKSQLVKDPAYKLDENSKVELLGNPTIEEANGQRTIVVQAKGRELPTFDLEAFKTQIAGKTKAEVTQIVAASYPQIDSNLLKASLDQIQSDPLPTADRLDLKLLPDYQVLANSTSATPGPDNGGTPGATPGIMLVPQTAPATPKA